MRVNLPMLISFIIMKLLSYLFYFIRQKERKNDDKITKKRGNYVSKLFSLLPQNRQQVYCLNGFTFHCCNKIPKDESFLKKLYWVSLQFLGLKSMV